LTHQISLSIRIINFQVSVQLVEHWGQNNNKVALKFYFLFLKVALSQKGLMSTSFLQMDESNHFPELEFGFFYSNWLKSCQIRT
jgi:hypothetical protein